MGKSESTQPSMTKDNIIPRVEDVPSYADFLNVYLKPNRPIVIGRDLVKDWPAFKLWTLPSSSSSNESGVKTINWDWLAKHYGNCEVSVADCSTCDSFGNLEVENAQFGSVVEKWRHGEGRSLYAKDWHLPRVVEALSSNNNGVLTPPSSTDGDGGDEDGTTQDLSAPEETDTPSHAHASAFYKTPQLFADDWMNAYYTTHTADDFRFVYCGARGTFTPLHRDVYCSYSWSTNICGRKRWWMFPPEETEYLFMKERRVCVHDVRNVDRGRFPEFGRARCVVLDQEEGETVFVPSGWYHQVENLTDCISINHNWCNAVNLPALYTSMCREVVRVEQALEDVRDMLASAHKGKPGEEEEGWRREFTQIVQDVTQKDAGWNWLTFWRMVLHALKGAAVQDFPELAQDPTLEHTDETEVHIQPVFPPARADLRPDLFFIVDKVRFCLDDFAVRDRYEGEGEVGDVVREIGELVERIEAEAEVQAEKMEEEA